MYHIKLHKVDIYISLKIYEYFICILLFNIYIYFLTCMFIHFETTLNMEVSQAMEKNSSTQK